jgi:O-methyltransferase involved in polyketide biosynthesis
MEIKEDSYVQVMRTNDDAFECRWSAVQAGLLPMECVDDRLRPRKLRKRPPLINRGTFIRTTAIDEFLASHAYDRVINLGAGFDTRPLRLLSPLPRGRVQWIEVDLPEVIQRKRACLPGYPARLIAADLSDDFGLDTVEERGRSLLLAECVFPYLRNHDRLARLVRSVSADEILLFEPVKLGDPFGRLLLQNVAAPMPCIFEDVAELTVFYAHLGYAVHSHCSLDKASLSAESETVLREKAGLDEYEEWALMSRHYLFVHLVKQE